MSSGNAMARDNAARAAGKKQKKHHHCQSVGRMAKKQHKALDQRDLYKDVAEAEGDEIEQRRQGGSPRAGLMAMDQERQDQERQHEYDRDDQQHAQNYHSQIDSPVHAFAGS